MEPLFRLPIEDLDFVVNAIGYRWERLRNKRILITGATGFIGKWLLGTLMHANRRFDLDAHAIVLSRRPELFLDEFAELRKISNIEWLTGDVRTLLPHTIAYCDFAIHAATDVIATSSPSEILDTCVTGTQRVLDALTSSDHPCRMLLLSSGAVYGRVPSQVQTIGEEWLGAPDPLMPSAAYGEGKRVSELLCAIAASKYTNLNVAIARCFAFVGPHLPMDKHFAIGNFIDAAMRGEDILIQGDGTPMRSYLYASDLAHWLWILLFDAQNARAYNVGGSEGLSIGELAKKVNHVLGGVGRVRIAQTPRQDVPPQAYVPTVTRIASELGLFPQVRLDDAILRTANWARSQHKV